MYSTGTRINKLTNVKKNRVQKLTYNQDDSSLLWELVTEWSHERAFKRLEISICLETKYMDMYSVFENSLSYTFVIVYYVYLNKKSKTKTMLDFNRQIYKKNSKAQNVQTHKYSNSRCDCLSILNILISIFILCHS